MAIKPPAPPYVGPPKWRGSTTNKPLLRIVIHCTAGAEPGVQNAARNTAAYSKNTSRPSSWHYCADARESVQLTYDSVVAYHDGTNSRSIGYELCCSLAAKGLGHWITPSHRDMLKIAAKDIARLCLANDIPIRRLSKAQIRAGEKGLCGHVDMRDAFPGSTSHWDPGPFFPWTRFLWMIRREAKRLLAEDAPKPTPAPVAPKPAPKPGKTLKGGSWNLRVGRRPAVAVREVLELLKDHDLDFLTVCEASGYVDAMENGCINPATGKWQPPLKGYSVHTAFDRGDSACDSAVIVRDGLKVQGLKVHRLERIGWERKPGRVGLHWPRTAVSVNVEGLRVMSVHMPPGPFKGPRFWRRGVAFDTSARTLRRIGKRWSNRDWLMAGDMNMTKRVAGTVKDPSMAWVATETGAQIRGTGIDYVLAHGCRVSGYRRIDHGTSDHKPVLFNVTIKENA